MEKGTDPASETVQRLAEKQRDLVQAFTGGDPAMAQSLKTMYEQEGPAKASRSMIDPEVGAYMAKAMAAARKDQ
ncbi:MAG: TipAS antibiotic-recognition domain-containing protein [Rhodothermales bacterium]